MEHDLETIKASSRVLLEDGNLSCSVRKLASAVYHGAELIDQHRLDQSHALPQFERALFHLCHATHYPLCQETICPINEDGNGQRCCWAIAHPHH